MLWGVLPRHLLRVSQESAYGPRLGWPNSGVTILLPFQLTYCRQPGTSA